MTEAEAREKLTMAIDAREPLRVVSDLYVAYVLAHWKGNRSSAAKRLGIDRRTIQRWMQVSASRLWAAKQGAYLERTSD